jgi:hypothetical protein
MAFLYARNKQTDPFIPVLVDEDVAIKYGHKRWYISRDGYIYRRVYAGESPKGWSRSKDEYLHRIVLGLVKGDGKLGDHINRSRMDNRRENLRVATTVMNAANRTTNRKLPRGVYRCKSGYSAYCTVGGKSNWLGRFPTVEEASEAARRWRLASLPGATD